MFQEKSFEMLNELESYSSHCSTLNVGTHGTEKGCEHKFSWQGSSPESAVAAAAKSLQSCPTLCNPIDGTPPSSPIPGILQARTLEWVTISFSNAWKWKVKVKSLSRVQLLATPWTATYQAPLSMPTISKILIFFFTWGSMKIAERILLRWVQGFQRGHMTQEQERGTLRGVTQGIANASCNLLSLLREAPDLAIWSERNSSKCTD